MEVVPLLAGLVMGFVTSYTDLKTGFIFDNHVSVLLALIGKLLGWDEGEEEVNLPGWLVKLPVPAVEIGILYYLYKGLSEGNLLVALSGIITLFVGLALGLFLFYIGAWASGDAIILAGFSALLPYPPDTAKITAPYYVHYPLYPVAILLNSLIAVFPFIFLYAFGIILLRKRFSELKEIFVSGAGLTLELSLWIMGAIGVRVILEKGLGLQLNPIAGWLLAIVLITVFGKLGKIGDAIGALILAYLAYLSPTNAVLAFLRLLAFLYAFKVFLALVRFIRRNVLIEEVPVEELREWDILGETIFEKDGEVKRDRTDPFERLKVALMSADLSILKPDYGKVIASPTAEGLTKEQIEELKRLVAEGRLENRFLRKKAMPFAPAIFLGFLISYFIGDIFWWLELKLMGL
ncbi:A24 family peptidase C-terminal domain-containing protein [Thermococcus sp.]|uniref:A24 family peptidase C-terminal domain-containing protein n=1 Tax=Thermococcus sp. TaxID=35749 RepID=UPI0026192DAD|nr:A24 family peptidase C-terminal domain-containing protein [Thermococcus sp.]